MIFLITGKSDERKEASLYMTDKTREEILLELEKALKKSRIYIDTNGRSLS